MRDVTLAVLAGGRGTRMGAPKGTLSLGGKPILEYLLSRIAWEGPTMLVLSPGVDEPAGSDRFERRVSDAVAGEGPMRGVMTSLENATTDVLVVATVDMPGVSRREPEFLVAEMGRSLGTLAVMLKRSPQGKELIEPFPSAYRTGARELVARLLAEGKRSMNAIAAEERVAVVPAPAWEDRVWSNLNRPEDLKAFERDAGLAP